MSIAGSNDLESSGALGPSLTTIRLDAEQVGIRTAEYIFRLIAGMPVAKFHDHPDEPDRSRKYSASGQAIALPLPRQMTRHLFVMNIHSFIWQPHANRACVPIEVTRKFQAQPQGLLPILARNFAVQGTSKPSG
jgi:hypothetical protein